MRNVPPGTYSISSFNASDDGTRSENALGSAKFIVNSWPRAKPCVDFLLRAAVLQRSEAPAGRSFRVGRLSLRWSSQDTPSRSLATMAGRLHCLEDAVEVVGLRRLHRWKLLVRHQLLRPQQ